jgi:DNA-binding NtrC family response regulator
VAASDATILITGESGTGKEIVARAIHDASRRRERPFMAVNCGGIPEALLESELFGHVKGAFTGATHARRGRFQLAEGGTLFLDEIGDMPLVLQVKLLRVIQEREFEVLGDARPQPANVRFIAATHRDLEQRVAEGRFRADLYYRLNVVPLHIPPLRARTIDIPPLVAHFVASANAAHGARVTGVRPEALEALVGYAWPGNVRELANVVERMAVLRRDGELEAGDVPPHVRSGRGTLDGAGPDLPAAGLDLNAAVADFEGALIDKALERAGGNRTQAARLLNVNRTTLVEKLRRRDTD